MAALVFGGGGARGFGFLGAVARLMEDPDFEITEVHGTSTGAIFGSAFANGHKPSELMDFATSLRPSTFMKFNWRFLWRPGLFTLNLKDVLDPWAPTTFKDARVPFSVYATGSQNGEHLIYSSELTPTLPTYLGIEASANFPLFFREKVVKGVRTWDGGIWNNLAVDQVRGREAVGIRLGGLEPEIRPWRWYTGAIKNLVALFMDALDREHIEDADFARIITLRLPISALDFHKLDGDMVKRLYEIGYETTEKRLASGWSWR